jgi:RNA polymerase sigma-70 factor, ECF subfamily
MLINYGRLTFNVATDTAELVQRALGGDIESFGELCRRHYTAMAAVAYAVLNDHQLAEDAAQETFARALVNLRNLKDDGRFSPWLAAICRNVANDMAKQKIKVSSTETLSELPQKTKDNGDLDAVGRAVSMLPAHLKELVVMRYYDGLSYEQISAVLAISPATINGRLTRAKRKMAKCLKRNGCAEADYET